MNTQTSTGWRAVAENTRDALDALGHTVPRCLPGEPEACGGSDAQHAAANFGALRAVVEHRVKHLPPGGPDIADDVYQTTFNEVDAESCDDPEH